MPLKRFTHDPINDFASLLCDHEAHDPSNRAVSVLYRYTEADHGGVLALCEECLAHDHGQFGSDSAEHEAKCGSPAPTSPEEAQGDLADDLGVSVSDLSPALASIVASYFKR